MDQLHGYFVGAQEPYFWLGTILLLFFIGFKGAPFFVWTILLATGLVGFGAPEWVLMAFAVVAVIGNIKPIRAILLSSFVMKIMKGILPQISETERTALEAGVVWVEGELFSGKPNFDRMVKESYPTLTAEEQKFIDGPVEELCTVLNEWDIHRKRELPKEFWDVVKREKFLGMIIPKEHGGLGFSMLAQSSVLQKLASRSVPATVTVMVPNSLGPAELLIHYGTDAQKNKYLSRLASGEEIPCFALTEPGAGSDAGSITSSGELFKGDDGKIYIKLNWNKRWITLAAISTIIGLAFKLRDPKNLLGRGEDLGITCALVPAKTPGVVLGMRHDPMGIPFYNCPTQGKDVVVVAEDAIIGGLEGAGRGWGMLMESLGAGRGVSLPAQSAGGIKTAARVTTAHATIRKQFGISIGNFEGVEEPLSRICGYNYMIEAMRCYTLGALDGGTKPPVITAIAKHYSTEIGRKVVNDAMDIMGGAGISQGPRNLISGQYMSTPIGITVEGANILTRTLMIFGQGALRAHPYAFKEVESVEKNDLKGFDAAFWGHMGHIVRNIFRSFLLSSSRGMLGYSPVRGRTATYWRRLSWASASFAILTDIAMGSLGGKLKFKEKITGRFADILAWMYMSAATLRRWEADGRREEDLPFVHWSLRVAFGEIDKAFDGIFLNLQVPGLSWFFRIVLRSWSGANPFMSRGVSDNLSHRICQDMLNNIELRERLTTGLHIPKDPTEQMARLERAFKIIKAAESAERKIKNAIKAKTLPKVKKISDVIAEALEKKIIDKSEYDNLKMAEEVRNDAIQVDSFSQDEYLHHTSSSSMKRSS